MILSKHGIFQEPLALLAMGRRFQAEERLQRLRKETVSDGSLVVKFGHVFLDGLLILLHEGLMVVEHGLIKERDKTGIISYC